MIIKLEETINENETETLFCKPSGLNNPETYVLKHNKFNTYLVLSFSDLKKIKFIKCLIEIAHIMKL